MKTSEDTAALSKALAAAQCEMSNPATDKTNDHFHNKYATLAAIRDACVPVLAKHGVAVIQGTIIDEQGFRLVTRLAHESGQWMESTYPLTLGPPQQMGSQVTYARRYSLSAMGAIVGDPDDDGEDATKHSKEEPVIPPKVREPNITEADLNRLQTAVVDTGVDLPKFLKYLGVLRLNELPQSRFVGAMAALEARRKTEAA